jgi:hypothetical protein
MTLLGWLDLKDPRVDSLGMFVYDLGESEDAATMDESYKNAAYRDLSRTPRPLRNDDFMGNSMHSYYDLPVKIIWCVIQVTSSSSGHVKDVNSNSFLRRRFSYRSITEGEVIHSMNDWYTCKLRMRRLFKATLILTTKRKLQVCH